MPRLYPMPVKSKTLVMGPGYQFHCHCCFLTSQVTPVCRHIWKLVLELLTTWSVGWRPTALALSGSFPDMQDFMCLRRPTETVFILARSQVVDRHTEVLGKKKKQKKHCFKQWNNQMRSVSLPPFYKGRNMFWKVSNTQILTQDRLT